MIYKQKHERDVTGLMGLLLCYLQTIKANVGKKEKLKWQCQRL